MMNCFTMNPIMFYTEIILHTNVEKMKQILWNVNQRHIGHAEMFVAKTTSLHFFISKILFVNMQTINLA